MGEDRNGFSAVCYCWCEVWTLTEEESAEWKGRAEHWKRSHSFQLYRSRYCFLFIFYRGHIWFLNHNVPLVKMLKAAKEKECNKVKSWGRGRVISKVIFWIGSAKACWGRNLHYLNLTTILWHLFSVMKLRPWEGRLTLYLRSYTGGARISPSPCSLYN